MLRPPHSTPLSLIAGVTPRGAAVATPPRLRFFTASLALELGILLSLSILFPFLIHLLPVPEDARLGPRLLPMFYAPLLAALLGRPRSAVIVALLAPWLNWALTSHPTLRQGGISTIQLLVFVLALRGLLGRLGARWYIAAPAYLTCMIVASLLATAFPALIADRPVVPWLLQSIVTGLPGIGVLLLINWVTVRQYPSGGEDGGPRTA